MTTHTSHDRFNRNLDASTTVPDDDQARFAARLRTVAAAPPPAATRRAMWETIVASQPAPRYPGPGPGPLTQPLVHKRSSRSSGFLPHGLPAPAVIFFGLILAVIVAISGLGNDGGDMVTPTAHAEQAATAAATPAGLVPTTAIVHP